MRELPGDVFVTAQLLPEQLQALAKQGVKSIINNRPDLEAPRQPTAQSLEAKAQELGLDYRHIPMAGGISPEMVADSVAAFDNLPRPIVAFCAGGMRSAALWAFAHVKELGVDGVLHAIGEAGFNLEQLRTPLTQYLSEPCE